MQIDDQTRRTLLARRHRLLPRYRTDDLPALVDGLVALHSSDPVTVYLSALTRMINPNLAEVERALYEQRSLIRHHSMRRTLWVATPATTAVAHAAGTLPYLAAQVRRTHTFLADSGLADPSGWLADACQQVLAELADHGPMTARQLGQRIPALAHPLVLARGTKFEGTQAAHTRVLLLLGMQAELVRTRPTGTWINSQYTWAAWPAWVGHPLPVLDPRQAEVELARAYLHAFGPATSIDLQWWAGWTVATTKRALQALDAVPVTLTTGSGWLAGDDPDLTDLANGSVEPEPFVAVLPGLDPTTMGWKQRDFYLPEVTRRPNDGAFDRNGNAAATIWVDGQVVGCWVQAPDGQLRTIWYGELAARRRKQVQQRLTEVQDWLGESRFNIRFPGPHQKQLLA